MMSNFNHFHLFKEPLICLAMLTNNLQTESSNNNMLHYETKISLGSHL